MIKIVRSATDWAGRITSPSVFCVGHLRSLHGPATALLWAVVLPMAPAQAGSVTHLAPWVLDCFSTQRQQACDQALIKAEALQRDAADQDRYPCQSLLLGLQADVVMVQLQAGRGQKALATLEEVREGCRGL